MSETKTTKTGERTGHTPGPWTVADYKTLNTQDHVIRSPEWGNADPHPVVATVVKRPNYSANARLIAAAPELLDNLAKTTIYLETVVKSAFAEGTPQRVFADGHIELNRAAIVKAEGK